jgi:hypothetical protein
MAVRLLKAPDRAFDTLRLKVVNLLAKKLFRISSHLTSEPFFGKRAAHRFDDPRKIFGTCYFGLKIDTAVAESILHDIEPVQGGYDLDAQKVVDTYVHTFKGPDLKVADLTGHHLNVLGGHADLFGTASYDLPMLWSRAVHEHPQQVDGFMYVSRLLTPHRAVVLFDRGTSLQLVKDSSTALFQSKPFQRVKRLLNIRYV